MDVQGQGSGRNLDVDGQGELGFLKLGKFSWTPFVYHPLDKGLSEFDLKSRELE